MNPAASPDDFALPEKPTQPALATPLAKIANEDHFIVLPSGDLSFTEAAVAIFKKVGAKRTLYYRGGQIHQVVVDPHGVSTLQSVTSTEFRSILEGYGAVFAWRAGERGDPVLKPSRCNEDQARTLMACAEAGRLLPHVTVISQCPILARGRDGGMELLGPGWHANNGGTFVTGSVMPEEVEFQQAVAALKELLADFDFINPGDRARALASLITPALKLGGWLKKLTPIDIGEADASQSGKTYRQEMVAAIYGLAPYVTGNSKGGVGSLDESLKQAIRSGHPFILIDNVRGHLNSEFLERVLTSPENVPCRVPHRGEVICNASNIMIQLTSNGVETTRDLVNRATIVRIRRRPPGYGFKSFDGLDAKSHVQAHQGYYLGCVFALIKEWCEHLNARSDIRTGTAFAEWASVLDWFTVGIFRAGPLMDGMAEAADRACDPKQNWLRQIAIILREKRRLGERLRSIQLAEFCMDNDALPPGIKPDAEEMVVARKIGSLFGGLFSVASSTCTVEGFVVTREQHYDKDKARNDNLYIFTEVPGVQETMKV